MLTLGANLNRAKSQFFDRALVAGKVDRASARNLSKFGAFVRTGARSSIRKRKRISAPGQPPSSHLGTLKNLIYFAYEPERQNVVIGPVLAAGGQAEQIEHGGMGKVRNRRGRARHARFRPRPFMQPAFDREQKKLPSLWANSVK